MIPMDREELLTVLGVVVGVPTLLQITPVKINPWSWIWKMLKLIWRAFCRSLMADVITKLDGLESDLRETKADLKNHIAVDDYREADKVRGSILRFNNELLRGIPHTKEEFIEVLSHIDWYNDFCRTHKDYKNSRAVHAITNIERVYDERLAKHDFL